ncbi:MAG TPA: glycosyltransferase [Noviherbaspirillum sp.]|jgi:UDP-N-acetylmuramyl pentapeptide phosphotransferase/UDP-N-acetylglucosamine-1-phosphate transferase|uniref:MraY family glycosyltransferase n=1 Tax=Noviherbaspirillum sp. TaxID=1926288 RepID=UPI002F935A94
MKYAIFSLFGSLLITFLVVRFSHLHSHLSADHDLNGVQKVHAIPVPRVGGIGIFFGLALSTALLFLLDAKHAKFALAFMLPCSLVFAVGLLEDLTKRVSVAVRLVVTMIAALVGCLLLDATVRSFGIPLIDLVFQVNLVAFFFTVVAVAGVANAINLIDGFNGLSGFTCVTTLLALAAVGYFVGDDVIRIAALICAAAVAGFLVWNYPKAKIFLGDGGAYLTGFVIAELAVLLRERNPEVSVLFPLLLVIYPVFETVFSIYRRKFVRGQSPGAPDAMHLHQLINKRLVRWRDAGQDAPVRARGNSMTSPYLWALNLLAVVPAVMFWNDDLFLLGFILLFIISYVWLYASIVRFQSPAWLPLPRRPAAAGDEAAVAAADADAAAARASAMKAD